MITPSLVFDVCLYVVLLVASIGIILFLIGFVLSLGWHSAARYFP